MSGHNKWSSIKHRKGAQDAKRGKIFTKIIREITASARLGGGDPDSNARLRHAIDLARASNMPADNVTRAIKKGTGELEGVAYEELTYEGVGPAGSLFVIQVMTDNRNRTAPEVRKIFDKHHGHLGASGSATWAFEEKGVIRLLESAATEEQLFEVAVGAGADDINKIHDHWVIITPREALDAVRAALEKEKIHVEQGSLAHVPKTPKIVSGHDAEVLMNLVEALEDHDDIQNVYSDFELSDEAVAALQA